MKRTFAIKQVEGTPGWYISKLKTKSENVVFTNKTAGGTEVLALLEAKKVSAEEAYELAKEIVTNNAIPFSDAKFKKNCTLEEVIAEISENMLVFLTNMLRISDKKGEAENEEKLGPLPRLEICKKCGKHGVIKGEGFTTQTFISKKMLAEIVATLKKDKQISKADAERLLKQGAESSLPEIYIGI